MTKEARIYNRQKTTSSFSGIEETGQQHINEIRTLPNNINF